MENRKTIVIAGAGLVGSLLSIFLAKKGHRVKVVEKRPDPRINLHREGRSINLALSYRGLKALEAADPNLPTAILSQAVPMYGRQMHDEQGRLSFQPYSNNNECIYSVSRAYLNNCLISQAEKEGVSFLFEHSIEETHFASKTLHVLHKENSLTIDAPVLFAADGVFSKIRGSLEKQGLCQSHIERIDHGYKELDIPADKGLLVEPFTALHIWPRGEYMLIALPNFDGSYTGTLFFPYKKEDHSFEKLDNEQSITDFFRTHFADAYPLLTNLYHQYTSNPISYLSNVYSNQWSFEEWLLVGDAAHGIVPFYGQGMNAGFEDCRLLMELLTSQHNDWSSAFKQFSQHRKKDTDAIARLAMDNFKEMSTLVADERFLLQKRIEAALSKALPDQWKTLYGEVTFSDVSYSVALARGKRNQWVMNEIMNDPLLDLNYWEDSEVWTMLIDKVKKLMKESTL